MHDPDKHVVVGILEEILSSDGFVCQTDGPNKLMVNLKPKIYNNPIFLGLRVDDFSRSVTTRGIFGHKYFMIDDLDLQNPNNDPTKRIKRIIKHVKFINAMTRPFSWFSRVSAAISGIFQWINDLV